MNIDQIKVGDRVKVKKEVSHNFVNCQHINRELDFCGVVEKISGSILTLDNPATVHVRYVVEVVK